MSTKIERIRDMDLVNVFIKCTSEYEQVTKNYVVKVLLYHYLSPRQW